MSSNANLHVLLGAMISTSTKRPAAMKFNEKTTRQTSLHLPVSYAVPFLSTNASNTGKLLDSHTA